MRAPFFLKRRRWSGATLKRSTWTVADQGLSSLTNLLLAVVVARLVSPHNFGAFGAAFATYLLLLNVSRALCTDALVVRFSAATDHATRKATRGSTGAVVAFGLVTSFCVFLVGTGLSGALGVALKTLAIAIPGLLLQDAWRFVFFARGRPAHAALNDSIWAVVQFSLLGAIGVAGHLSPGTAILAWGGGASVAALVGCFQARVVPRPLSAVEWLSSQRDLWPVYLGELASRMGGYQVTLYLVGLFAGLAALGSVRAADVLLGPVFMLFMGVGLVALPECVRLRSESLSKLRRLLAWLSVGLALVTLLWGMAVWTMPVAVSAFLLGDTAAGAKSAVIPDALYLSAFGAALGPIVGLRALQASRRSLRIRITVLPVTLVVGAIGAQLFGAVGALLALAVVSWISVAMWWRAFSAALDDEAGALVVLHQFAPVLRGTGVIGIAE